MTVNCDAHSVNDGLKEMQIASECLEEQERGSAGEMGEKRDGGEDKRRVRGVIGDRVEDGGALGLRLPACSRSQASPFHCW